MAIIFVIVFLIFLSLLRGSNTEKETKAAAIVLDFPEKEGDCYYLYYWPEEKRCTINRRISMKPNEVDELKNEYYTVSFSTEKITKVVYLPGRESTYSFFVSEYGTILIKFCGLSNDAPFKSLLTSKM